MSVCQQNWIIIAITYYYLKNNKNSKTFDIIFMNIDNSVYHCLLFVFCSVSYIFTVKNKDLAEKRTELRKQLQVTQEDLDAWAAALPPLMEVKRGLGNQKDEFKQQLEEIEKESEENKEKIQSVEKEIIVSDAERATERTEGLLRQKQNLLDAQWKLEKRQGEVEKQQLNVQKELQRTNDLIKTMTERKRKLENRMEVNQTYLDEVDSQNDKTHLHSV